jgi:transcriptional regulator of acetoin/glycerol metabolism
VRELENALEFAATVSTGQTLQLEDLPPEVASAGRRGPAPSVAAEEGAVAVASGSSDERAAIERALEEHRWRRADAARALGMSRSTLWRRMRALGLEDVAPIHSA